MVRKTSYRFSIFSFFALIAFASSALAANLQIIPTTTRTAETSNNTSAPDTINSSTSGYAASGNISKLPIRSLLYPGATTKVYAALMGWWGKSGHISIGENSQSPAVVKSQIEDMQSRGIDGAILAWYGKGTFQDVVAQQLKTQAEAHQNFSFVIMIDQGTIQWDSMGLSPTDAIIYHLNYIAQTYYSSPAYAKIGGRPIVLEFGTELWNVDWTRVLASVQGNPAVFFRNPGAFTNVNAFGGYGWGPANGISYTDYFNKTALQHPEKVVMADAWKGFNDVLASWSKNRVTDQQCGQTWLNSMSELSKFYSTGNQLPFLQIATWNDYEEGTTIESGIDNCVTVNATTSGTSLQWQLGGAGLENTIDHYTAYISTDGENLMSLGDIPTGTYSLDLSQFNLAAGNYTLYVKATGKASLKNQMSNAAAYVKVNVPPTAAVTATPASAPSGTAVTASTVGSSDVDGSVVSSSIDFGDGAVLAGPTAAHAYAAPGTYTITATVTDNMGATASAKQVVTVTSRTPSVVLGVTPGSGYEGVQITASTTGSTAPAGAIASSVIDFGDGMVTAGPSHTHQYSTAGTYTVKATVTDNLGASSVATKTIVISPAQVVITLPATQPSSATPLNVKATAYSGRAITGMYVYVDNVAVYNTSASSLNVNISLKSGPHTLLVKAWDNTGRILSSSTQLTVAAGSIAPRTSRTATSTSARLTSVTTDGGSTTTGTTAVSPRSARLGR